ncbi:MAG: UDP-3-O-(3-hydroxymyristoyl)glucosamine N-acyltransferase [Chthonomonadales bacterium]|nr:UDP-3-O-(3-hydroxymyristoyl)glucosamine N-acyltransferase [Chthonomonadales bacterium]
MVVRDRPVKRQLTVDELANAVHGAVSGDGRVPIVGVASIQEAEIGDVVFAESPKYLTAAGRSRASAVVAFLDAVSPDKPLIRVENPRAAFTSILGLFSNAPTHPIGIHHHAIVGKGVTIAPTASIAAGVTVGDRVSVGEGTVLFSGCVIGDDTVIGSDCVIYPNVVLYPSTVLGDRVIVHAGAVIGSDGFGFVRMGETLQKVPHLGNVVLEDDVEIGANVTVDRGKTGSTVIGARTKIDNLVQIAHNVRIGPDTVIAALVGIAGSASIGQRVTMAGQVGVKDHVKIGDGAILLGRTGAWGDVDPGSVVSGSPAMPHRERLRQEAAVVQGPSTVRQVRELVQEMERLRERVAELDSMLGRIRSEPLADEPLA